MNKPKQLTDSTVYRCYVGSKAHGLYMSEEEYGEMATCDIDIMEFFIYDLEFYLTTKSLRTSLPKLTQTKQSGEYDIVRHELRKGVDLLIKGNPNMLVLLFTDSSNILDMSIGGQMLRENKNLFLAKDNIKNRFKGYAYDQLSRLERGIFNGYMGDKRKKIVEKFGYDTKNAMTLIRLMNEALEALVDETITVNKEVQGTRDYYLDIKTGKWSLDEVKAEAERLSNMVDAAYSGSKLPAQVDQNRVDELLFNIMSKELGR